MTYRSGAGGLGTYGGFGYHSLGATLNIVRRPDSDAQVRALQQQLVRLGFLAPTTTSTGVDGRWGPYTALATENAARYVGWTGAAFSPASARTASSGVVTVPDDLMARIRAARPAPSGTPGVIPGPGADATAPVEPAEEGVTFIGPHLDQPAEEPVTDDGGDRWLLPVGIGAGVLAAGIIVALVMTTKGPPQRRPVTANRRRRKRKR